MQRQSVPGMCTYPSVSCSCFSPPAVHGRHNAFERFNQGRFLYFVSGSVHAPKAILQDLNACLYPVAGRKQHPKSAVRLRTASSSRAWSAHFGIKKKYFQASEKHRSRITIFLHQWLGEARTHPAPHLLCLRPSDTRWEDREHLSDAGGTFSAAASPFGRTLFRSAPRLFATNTNPRWLPGHDLDHAWKPHLLTRRNRNEYGLNNP